MQHYPLEFNGDRMIVQIRRSITSCDYNQALGLGFVLSWSLSALCSSTVYGKNYFAQDEPIRLTILAFICLSACVCLLIFRKGRFVLNDRSTMIVSICAGCLIFGSYTLWNFLSSIPLAVLAIALATVGFVVLILVWASSFAEMFLYERVVTFVGASLFSAILFLVSMVIPSPANQTLSALFPLASSPLLVFRMITNRTVDAYTEKSSRPSTGHCLSKLKPQRNISLFINIFAYGILFTLSGYIAFGNPEQSSFGDLLGCLGVLAFLCFEIAWSLFMMDHTVNVNPSLAFGPTPPAITLGALLVYFAGNTVVYNLGVLLFFVGFGVFFVYLWGVLGNTSQKFCEAPGLTYSRGFFLLAGGSLSGELLIDYISYLSNGRSPVIQSLVVLSLVVMIISFWVSFDVRSQANETFDMGGTPSTDDLADEDSLSEIKAQLFAARYKLSPREAEIIKLVIKGRDIPRISEELFIAQSTTRTHIKHIYEKASVSSRQKLIDLIEAGFTDTKNYG